MGIVEQRKAVLADGHGKSLEEIQAWLGKSGFDLKKGYTSLRGAAATIFIQDIEDEKTNEKRKRFGEYLRGVPLPTPPRDFEAMKAAPVFKDMEAIMVLLQQKLKDGKSQLTPIEILLAKVLGGMAIEHKDHCSHHDDEDDDQ